MPPEESTQNEPAFEDALLDKLAAVEHDRWAHWQNYLHSQCDSQSDGSLTIPADLVARWTRQASTPFAELNDDEKESDREQVRRYLPHINAAWRAKSEG